MARIRTIKPEFFDDEQLCALPFSHRLCFAGLWTQADKAGRMEDRPQRLKARIFPYDDVDMELILSELAIADFIVRYVVAGSRYLAIKPTGWMKHQRPRPDEPESLLPPIDTAAVTDSPLRRDGNSAPECLGKEGKGKERKGGENADGPSAADAQSDDLAEAWNEITSSPIPRCQQLTTKRRRHAHARLTERPLTEWREVFTRIQAATFCQGHNDRGWVASFDWVIGSADVAVKVLEGKYDDRRKKPRAAQPEPTYRNWSEECQELHGGTCTKQWDHGMRMKTEGAA